MFYEKLNWWWSISKKIRSKYESVLCSFSLLTVCLCNFLEKEYWQKAAYIMLLKFSPAVNFINFKRVRFSYERWTRNLYVTRKKLPKQRSYEKFVHLTLLKFSPGGWSVFRMLKMRVLISVVDERQSENWSRDNRVRHSDWWNNCYCVETLNTYLLLVDTWNINNSHSFCLEYDTNNFFSSPSLKLSSQQKLSNFR